MTSPDTQAPKLRPIAGAGCTHANETVKAREDFALRHPIAVAAVAILGLVPCGSLTAQPVMPAYPAPYPGYYPGAYGGLPPYEVLAIVRSKGLEPLSRPRRQGPAYALRALDPADREVQVTVDARTGRILRVVPTSGVDTISPPNPIPQGRMVPDGYGANSRSAGYPNPADEMRGEERNAVPSGAPAPVPAASGREQGAKPGGADTSGSKPGGAGALPPLPRPRPKTAATSSLSASAADPLPAVAAPGPTFDLEE